MAQGVKGRCHRRFFVEVLAVEVLAPKPISSRSARWHRARSLRQQCRQKAVNCPMNGQKAAWYPKYGCGKSEA